MQTESGLVLIDVKFHLTLHCPGRDTERKAVDTWPEINAWVTAKARKRDYPAGTVLRVKDWTGTQRFLVRGGKEPPKLIRLSENVHGLPANPKMPFATPAAPSLDFSLPE